MKKEILALEIKKRINKKIVQRKWAEALPVLRKRARLTQSDLAKYLDVSRQTIYLYENKKKSIPFQTVFILSWAFFCDPLTCDFLEPMEINILNNVFKDYKGTVSIHDFFNQHQNHFKKEETTPEL